jgi:ribosomal protein L16/L10AE
MEGINEQEARAAFKLAAAKLPVRTMFVARSL